MKTIKRIGRRLGALLLVLCLAVSVFPAATLAASSYSSTKAISYAKSHWNDGQGLCAEFVSNCLKSGGCSAWSVNCGQLLTQLKNGGYGAVYQLKVNSDGRISQSANSGKVSAGDPIFCYCSKESSVYRYTHVYLCSGSSSAGYLTGYAHNNAKNGSTIYASTCGYCGGKLTAVYAFHMNGSGGTAASSTQASTLAIRPTAYPTGSLTQGSYYSLKGTVSSNYKITSVKGEIINSSGKAVCSYTQKPNSTSFSIYNSTLDKKMTFNTLSPGTYYLKYTAADASGKTVTWKSGNFTVKAKTSTLSIKPTAYPTGTLTQGSYYSLKGAVSSNYKITSVKGEIINSSGKAVCSYTQKPNSTSFSIYNSTLDSKMTFNTLSPGIYYLKYTAADASGKTITWKSGSFTVKAKQTSTGTTTKTTLYWPLSGGAGTVSSYPGWRGGVYHAGTDIAVSTNTKVLAVADGVVKDAGWTNARGYYVVVYHEKLGLTSIYQHLRSYSAYAGQSVKAGQELGRSGSTGDSTGPHLHLELIKTDTIAASNVECGFNCGKSGQYSKILSTKDFTFKYN